MEGVAAGRLGVGREDQVDPVAGQLGGDGPDGVVAVGGDVADVHGQDPARVAPDDAEIEVGGDTESVTVLVRSRVPLLGRDFAVEGAAVAAREPAEAG